MADVIQQAEIETENEKPLAGEGENAATRADEHTEDQATEAGDDPDKSSGDGDTEGKDQGEQKPKSGVQKRIDELTKARREAERRADDLARELSDIRAKNQSVDKEPLPSKPKEDDYDSYGEFVEARLGWEKKAGEVEQYKAREKELETRRGEEVQSAAMRVWEEGKERYPDFDQVFTDKTPVSSAMGESIISSDHAADIAYFLGKNPEEAKRISSLPPIKAALEIGRLESRLAAQADKVKEAKKVVTTAPDPVQPVGSKPAVSRRPDEMTMDEWVKWREQQINKKR